MKRSYFRIFCRLLATLLLCGLVAPATLTASAAELNPDKTNEPQPAELVSEDYAFISDLYWITNQAYNGGSAIRDGNCAGEYIWSCDLKKWDKGVGIHAASGSFNAYVDVNIEGIGYTKFATWYGVCETLSGNDISMACIKFAIFGDGEKIFESQPMRYNQPFEYIEVDVTGVKTLRIAIAGAPGIAGAWGIFGGAVLSKSGNVDDITFYRELVIENPTPETEADTKPVTEPVTVPETQAISETVTEQVNELATVPETQVNTEATTDAPSEGCGGVVGGTALLMAGAAAIVFKTLKKGKEE